MFLFCCSAFLSISLLASVIPVSLFLFLRPCLIHARMPDTSRAFVHGHTFLHSWSGPMTLLVGLLHGATFLSYFMCPDCSFNSATALCCYLLLQIFCLILSVAGMRLFPFSRNSVRKRAFFWELLCFLLFVSYPILSDANDTCNFKNISLGRMFYGVSVAKRCNFNCLLGACHVNRKWRSNPIH